MTLVGRSVGGKWRTVRTVANGSSTVDADSLALGTFYGVKYIIHFKNLTEDKYKTLELLGTRIEGDGLRDSVVGRLGDTIDVDASLVIDGSLVVLRIVNNETYTLDVAISKLITS